MNLRVVEFQLLQACNARCLYCAYEQNASKNDKFLPLSVIDKTLKETTPEWVWFEGGEVSLSNTSMEYLLEAMAIAQKYGVKCRINTNAQNLTPDWAQRLAKGGLQFACVSFDSLHPETYARLRGYNPKQAEKHLNQLKTNALGLMDAGVTVDLEATVTKYNLKEFISLYDHAQQYKSPDHDVLMGLQFLAATYDEIFAYYPDPEDVATYLSEVVEHAKKGDIPLRMCCSPLVPCKYPDLYEPHENIIWVGCGCGYDYVHIHASGDVHLCGFWDHAEPIGNLHKNSLREIWATSSLRKKAMETVPTHCQGCSSWEGDLRCHNTCFSVSYRKSNDFSVFSFDYLRNLCEDRQIANV